MPKITEPREGEPIRLIFTKRGEPRYRVMLDAAPHPDGKRRQVRSTHDTLTEAREHVAAHRTDRRRGQLVTLDRADRRSFAEFATAWLAGRVDGTLGGSSGRPLRANTAAGYRSALNRAIAAFGGMRVSEVTEVDIERMLGKLRADGTTRRSAAFTLFVVRAALDHAVARKLLPRNPAKTEGIAAAGSPSKSREAFTAAQISKLRAELAADRDRRLADAQRRRDGAPREAADLGRRDRLPADGLYACWLLTLCGLRRSEVLGLRWTDVDLRQGTVAVTRGRVAGTGRDTAEGPPKTERGFRTLPLSSFPDVIDALRAMRERQRADFGFEHVRGGYLAVDAMGRPLRPEVWTDAWRRHCSSAGLPALTLHSARHTLVTLLRDAGVPDHIVAAWAGHDEVTMRRTYSHAHRDELSKAAKALTQAFEGSG